MVALNLLAASLLVAGVGSSLGLPSPMNVPLVPFSASASLFDGVSSHYVPAYSVMDTLEVAYTSSYPSDFGEIEFFCGELGGSIGTMPTLAGNGFTLYCDSESFDSISISTEALDAFRGFPCLALVCPVYGGDLSYISVSLPDFSQWLFESPDYEFAFYVSLTTADVSPALYFGSIVEMDEALVLDPVSYADLGADLNPVTAITDGLTAIAPLGGALTDGFDAVFMDDGSLTAVGTFAFILMGVGISVGITKKCFNWVTGRHGM